MVAIFLLLIPLLFFLPQIIKAFASLKGGDKTQEEIAVELEAETVRQDKGAACNTIDFLFGEGSCEDSGLRPDLEEKTMQELDKNADLTEDRKDTDDKDTIEEIQVINQKGKKKRFRAGR